MFIKFVRSFTVWFHRDPAKWRGFLALDSSNHIFSLAWQAVEQTSCNLFLTGKAGTGKTTFLKYVIEHTRKNTVVVAPTGVAAIQAGGVTIHSFFQLPFQAFIPERSATPVNARFVDPHSLLQGMRTSRQKIELLNELELLVIDEVSMVRCDLLDMIDETLRHFRKNNFPFGGVQVLFIGDMYQLPPVVREEDWHTLRNYYESPFFFSAKAVERNPLLFIELKKIYRQSDETFIRILNNIRNNACTNQDLDQLNERFLPEVSRKNITLVTHNFLADQINREELAKLNSPLHRVPASVNGLFPENSYPCEQELQLKVGAQVMFIKNDSSGEKRYYNGKLATVKSAGNDGISVQFKDSGDCFELEKETWSNMQYQLDRGNGTITEEEIGSFTQYPLRLAWAVTIHKSQGLTFDEVTIDGGRSFAAGQMYVALSRCRTLEGITLLSPVHASHIITDRQIVDFSAKENNLHNLEEILVIEKRKYSATALARAFEFGKLAGEIEKLKENTSDRQLPDKHLAATTMSLLLRAAQEQSKVAEKFISELTKRFGEKELDEDWLTRKVIAAKTYFIEELKKGFVLPLNTLQQGLKGKKKVRKYSKQLEEFETYLWNKIKVIESASYGSFLFAIPASSPPADKANKKNKTTTSGGDTRQETLTLHKQGLNAEEIAGQRKMARSTIEGHLADLVASGDANVLDLMDEQLLGKIKAAAEIHGVSRISPIKAEIGDEASYGQIRIALQYLKR